jgi:hypothetical protein
VAINIFKCAIINFNILASPLTKNDGIPQNPAVI